MRSQRAVRVVATVFSAFTAVQVQPLAVSSLRQAFIEYKQIDANAAFKRI